MTKQIQYDLTIAEQEFLGIKDALSDYWKNIGINIFEWKRKNGEPLDTIASGLTSEIIEEYLYDEGQAIWIKDDNLGFMCLKALAAEELNVYFRPTKWDAIGRNYVKQFDVDHAVLIKNNSLLKPTRSIVDYYVTKMADIEMTKDLRRNAHKTPLILETGENTLLTAKNMFKKIRANEPVMYKNRNKGEGNDEIKALDTNIEYINDKLEDDYHNYEARILTALGLDNYVEDKAERVQSAEVESQQEYIIASFRASLNERKKACEKINKMFGLDLEVDYVKGEQIETDEPVEEIESEEVVENE